MRGITAVSALLGALVFSQAGLAQVRTLQFDLNNLAFQAQNSAGAPAPFGGLTHTGSLVFSDALPTSELVGILIRTGAGPFVSQPGSPWNLTDASVTINLSNGSVTGGNFSLDINGGPGSGGDRYTAAIGAAGNVSTFVGGGFQVEGLTSSGAFSDGTFGSINISDFFGAQGGSFLTGSFLAFRIVPDGNGAGFADVDAFVSNVPAPGSVAVLGATMLFATRRRRR